MESSKEWKQPMKDGKYIVDEDYIKNGENFYKSLKNKIVYTDSNILMNKNFKQLLNELIAYQISINILKVEYDEIYNLSKSKKDNKSYKARQALRNIETLLDENLLNLLEFSSKRNKNAYADPEFIKTIIENIIDNKKIIFITEDRGLRIELKHKLKDYKDKSSNIDIYTFNDLLYPQEHIKLTKIMNELKEENEKILQEEEKLENMKYCLDCDDLVEVDKEIMYEQVTNGRNKYRIEKCSICGYELDKKFIKFKKDKTTEEKIGDFVKENPKTSAAAAAVGLAGWAFLNW